jgi:hypothetical protein
MSRLFGYGWSGSNGVNSLFGLVGFGTLTAAFYFGYLKEDTTLGFVLGAFGAFLFIQNLRTEVADLRKSRKLSDDLNEKDQIYREIEDVRKEIGHRIDDSTRSIEKEIRAIECHMTSESDRRCSKKECLREMAGN